MIDGYEWSFLDPSVWNGVVAVKTLDCEEDGVTFLMICSIHGLVVPGFARRNSLKTRNHTRLPVAWEMGEFWNCKTEKPSVVLGNDAPPAMALSYA